MPTVSRFEWPQFTSILARGGQFRESYFVTDPGEASLDQFCSFPARYVRYAVLWAHYEGNVYRRVHRTASGLKREYGLDEFTRSVLNPTYELVQFYAIHTMGGPLDDEAGDGRSKPSALPIEIPEANPKADALRAAIARLWRESNWQIHKENFVRFGAAMGDVFLYVEDDERRGRVKLRVVHPRTVESVQLDPYGNVRGYTIREWRCDPREGRNIFAAEVLYTERCTKVGQAVHFETFLGDNEEPWDWTYDPDDSLAEWRPAWTEDYGFVPMVKVQHSDVGIGWGWAEIFPSLSRVHEIDDLISKLDDQIRKIVLNPRMATGTSPPGTTAANGAIADNALVVPWAERDDDDEPEAARGDQSMVYNPNDKADVKSLLGTLDIAAASAHIVMIRREIDKIHPELQDDRGTASGDASGRALTIYRQAKEARVRARRLTYDDALVRAQMMAVSIAGQKGYEGYQGFSEASYQNGELDHKIGARPVFAVTEADKLADEIDFATALKTMMDAGLPMGAALRRLGVGEEDIEEILEERDQEDEKKTERERGTQRQRFADEDETEIDETDMAGESLASGPGQAVPVGGGQVGRFQGA